MEIEAQAEISRHEIKEAILRSGYLLESRVEAVLRDLWGYVETNTSYQDPRTSVSRELDVFSLSAEKAGPEDYDFIFGALLIECINNPQPLVMLTKDPLIPFLHHEEVKLAGLPVKILKKDGHDSWQRLSDFLGMEKYHHYCKGRIATQFCSFVRKKTGRKDEWMATHEGSHFDSFRKLCDATDYFIDNHFKSWKFNDRESVNINFYYPVLILQGELLEGIPTKRSITLRKSNHLQFRRTSISNGKEIDYQIDIITESYLPKFINLLGEEIQKSARLLRRRHKIVRESINKIVEDASKFENPEEFKLAMDYDT